jgi:hypothetical protein
MKRLFLSALILVGTLTALIPATASAQAQNASTAPPCGATASTPPASASNGQNQTVQQSAQNVENAAKQLGSIFKKKSSQPSNANANPAPCPPAAATAPAPASASKPPTGSPGRGAAPSPASAATGVNYNKPFTPPADVKIQVAQLGPLTQGSPFFVSPHGTHVATEAHAGSRIQIVYDGAAGPVFDSFAQGGGSIVSFSPDGSHYGYCGVSGETLTVIVDGKAVGTSNQLDVDHFDCLVFFSPNSKHFYYISHVGNSINQTHARFVIDGTQEMDFGDANPQNFVFSPDGEHFAAYLYAYPSKTAPNGMLAMEIVADGKILNWPGNGPVWSADSQHLFTMGQSGQKQILYRDGQQIMTASNIRLGAPPLTPGLTASPAGDAPVAIAHDSNGGVGGVLKEEWYLTMNGKQIPGTLLQKTGAGGAAQILDLTVNQDGKHYAAIFKGANGKQYLFSDGKQGQYYDGINPTTVQFTSPTSEPIYVASNANVQYLIVGSQETAVPSINSILVDPVGDHVAAEGFGGFLDGHPLNLSGASPNTTQVHAFSFAPDGKNYAYLVFSKATYTLYIDGAALPDYAWIGSVSDKAPLWTAGTNIVFLCGLTNPAQGNHYGLCFDGKYGYLAANPVFGNMTLTPDASHIYFTAGISQGGFRLFLDGVPLLEAFPLTGFTGAAGIPAATWEVEPDGRLQILAQDNTGIKRYTITPGTSTSVSSLVGSPAAQP